MNSKAERGVQPHRSNPLFMLSTNEPTVEALIEQADGPPGPERQPTLATKPQLSSNLSAKDNATRGTSDPAQPSEVPKDAPSCCGGCWLMQSQVQDLHTKINDIHDNMCKLMDLVLSKCEEQTQSTEEDDQPAGAICESSSDSLSHVISNDSTFIVHNTSEPTAGPKRVSSIIPSLSNLPFMASLVSMKSSSSSNSRVIPSLTMSSSSSGNPSAKSIRALIDLLNQEHTGAIEPQSSPVQSASRTASGKAQVPSAGQAYVRRTSTQSQSRGSFVSSRKTSVQAHGSTASRRASRVSRASRASEVNVVASRKTSAADSSAIKDRKGSAVSQRLSVTPSISLPDVVSGRSMKENTSTLHRLGSSRRKPTSTRSTWDRGWQQPDQFIRQFKVERLLPPKTKSSRTLPARIGKSIMPRSAADPSNVFTAGGPFAGSTQHRCSFSHESTLRVVWDLLVVVFVLCDVLLTPLALSFHLKTTTTKYIDMPSNVVYLVDFGVRFLTSYTTEHGVVLVSHPKLTALHYLQSRWIVFDFVSCFPWEKMIANAGVGRLIGVTKGIRIFQLSHLARQILPLWVSGHVGTCYWNWIADDWRTDFDDYDHQSLYWRYSLCWSTVIGALNASPPTMHSPKEEISIALFMIMGNVLQATVFGSVAHLISSFNEQEDEYQKKLKLTHDRCKFLGIPDLLSRRIQAYYQNLYRETKTICADADAFINELSPALVCDVKYQLYRDMLKRIPFLASRRVDNSVVELLVMHLTAVIFMKDDLVARRGERADWMGFIGAKGSVAVVEYSNHVHRIGRVLRKGDYFGEMALLQQAKRIHTIVALNWVQIHQLHRQDLDSVKSNYPDQAKILEEEMHKYMSSKAANKL